MSHTIVSSLVEGVEITSEAPDQLLIASGAEGSPFVSKLQFTQLSSGLREALESLGGDGRPLAELTGVILKSDGFAGLAKLQYFLKRLGESAFLQHTMLLDGAAFAAVRPLSPRFRFDPQQIAADKTYVLSRFAYLRRAGAGQMILASPTSHGIAALHHPSAVAAVHCLTGPSTAASVAEALRDLDEESARGFMTIIASAGTLEAVDDAGETRDNTDPALGQWSFHDLAFHTRSRMGRHDNPYGATFKNAKKFKPLPIAKPPMSDEIISLYKPDMDKLIREDAPFSAVQDRRRSVREYGETPIHVDQLGEFLYRSARIKHRNEEGGVSWRPSPGGGAIHELEIYPVVQKCEGLKFGLYHYEPAEHTLSRVTSAPDQEVHQLLQFAMLAGVLQEPPQLLLVIASRFQRIQLKYESVAYAITLKNVGCLYQTMYLVAEAMGLAPCALGGGDADLFARTAGLDYYAEASVGEFLLGSGPATRPEPFKQPKGLADGRPLHS